MDLSRAAPLSLVKSRGDEEVDLAAAAADDEDAEDETLFFVSLDDEGIGALLGTPLLIVNTPLPRAEAVPPRVGDVGGRLDNFDPPVVVLPPAGDVGREYDPDSAGE